MFRLLTFLFILSLAATSPSRAQQQPSVVPAPGPSGLSASPPATNTPASGSPGQPKIDPITLLLYEGVQLLERHQLDAAMDKANAAIQAAPENAPAYELRGTIDVEKKLWDQAVRDYQTALRFDDKNTQLKFNIAEIQFKQGKYDAARPGYVALEHDMEAGDISSYKVFLCDLFGGHEDAAAKELDAFNQAGRNASYYFANAAWCLYHHKTEEAHGWLASAVDIYDPSKCRIYAISLIDLGYLPTGPPPAQK